jgi:hypothetical protein
MKTTQKVAPKPSAKRSPKKLVQTSPVTQKLHKKATKQTKTISAKHSTVKKEKVTDHSKKLHSKLERLTTLHAKAIDTRKANNGARIQDENDVLVSVSTPTVYVFYRNWFPADMHKIAVYSARYSGLFFAIVGAISTLFFATGAFSAQNQLASLNTFNPGTSGSTSSSNTAIPIDCTDPLQYLSPTCASSVDQTPDATFTVQGTRSALTGSVRVQVTVLHAQRVRLLAFSKSANQDIMLGLMSLTSNGTWEFNWNTTAYNDGDYKLKVLIDNGYGSYQSPDSTLSTIENYPIPNTSSATSTPNTNTQAASGTTGTTTPLTQVVTLTVDTAQSASEFRFEIRTKTADIVKLYAIHTPTNKQLFLGNAYYAGNETWKYKWGAQAALEGEYKVVAQVIANAVSNPPVSILVTKLQGTTNTVSTTTQTTPNTLKPLIDIDIQANIPLSGTAGIKIDVAQATKVEMFVQAKNSLQKRFLGGAVRVDTDTWIYRFDTTQMPNGEYVLIAEVSNSFGTYTEQTSFTKIFNALLPTLTQIEEEKIEALKEAYSETQKTVDAEDTPAGAMVLEDNQKTAQTLIAVFAEDIENALELLKVALRTGDTDAIEKIKTKLRALQQTVIQTIPETENGQDIQEYIRAYFVNKMAHIEEGIALTQQIIKERTKEEASLDSDKDGITNFDEVTIYKTNPFIPDSDNDGFIDGAEILNGYDPTNATPEVLVTYESPKEEGVVREDILAVHAITTVQAEEGDTKTTPHAIITGTALPNSFVTLYIFSTPVIVTLKTESDGSWSYRFDKEIEDGKHQVYVGITDNAGKIVAKSNPFTFIKEAQAFTTTDDNTAAPSVPVVQDENTFLSEYMVYLVLSVSVVAIGLVLILLGVHLDGRQKKVLPERETALSAL